MASGESLREVCRTEGLPSESTVREWALRDQDGFAAKYKTARELQAEAWADEMIEIADDGTNDWMERQSASGVIEQVINHDHIARSRLRVDTRKWIMAKLKPGTYGDKVQHANAAGDGNQEVIYRWADPEPTE
jgi:hypothetical protein